MCGNWDGVSGILTKWCSHLTPGHTQDRLLDPPRHVSAEDKWMKIVGLIACHMSRLSVESVAFLQQLFVFKYAETAKPLGSVNADQVLL